MLCEVITGDNHYQVTSAEFDSIGAYGRCTLHMGMPIPTGETGYTCFVWRKFSPVTYTPSIAPVAIPTHYPTVVNGSHNGTLPSYAPSYLPTLTPTSDDCLRITIVPDRYGGDISWSVEKSPGGQQIAFGDFLGTENMEEGCLRVDGISCVDVYINDAWG